MNSLAHFYRSIALSAVGVVVAGGALAQTWDLDACSPGSKSAAVYAGCGALPIGGGITTTTNITVDIRAYQSTGAAFTSASINNGGSYIGVLSGTENGSSVNNNHAIDNNTSANGTGNGGVGSSFELVHLQFSKAVDLTQLVANYTGADGDFQVYRWDYNASIANPTITGFSPTAMAGWTAVTTADFSANYTQSISDGSYFSSSWLISTPLGGSGGNDAFKLGTITATAVCGAANQTGGTTTGGVCAPTTGGGPGIPEPASLALFAVAALGAGMARRRSLALRA